MQCSPEVLRQRPLFGLAVPKGARVPARSGGAKWLLVAQVVDLAPLAELAKALEGPLVPRRVLRLVQVATGQAGGREAQTSYVNNFVLF